MALFGRETPADEERARRIKAWIAARHPHSLLSVMFGTIAVVDAFTLVLGVPAGVAAVVLSILGRRQIRRDPHRLGLRLCTLGLILGLTGIALSVVMATVVYPWVAAQNAPAP